MKHDENLDPANLLLINDSKATGNTSSNSRSALLNISNSNIHSSPKNESNKLSENIFHPFAKNTVKIRTLR